MSKASDEAQDVQAILLVVNHGPKPQQLGRLGRITQ